MRSAPQSSITRCAGFSTHRAGRSSRRSAPCTTMRRRRRLRVLVGDAVARDGRPRRNARRRAAAFRLASRRALDRRDAAGDVLHRSGLPRPVAQAAEVGDLGRRPEQAEAASGVAIKPKDTVLLHMDFNRRCYGTPAYVTDFPGLTKASATWLGERGIGMFGVEAISPGRPGRANFEVHHVCRDLGFTHMEGLANLDKLVGKGRFRVHRLPAEDQGRHRQPDPRGGVARWLNNRADEPTARRTPEGGTADLRQRLPRFSSRRTRR